MTEIYGTIVSNDPTIVSVSHRCDECARVSIGTRQTSTPHTGGSEHVRRAFRSSQHPIDWEPKSVLGKVFPDIPEHIAEPASEAFKCFSIGAYRAAVLLARAVIEASAKDKDITTGSLRDKIDKLSDAGHIRPLLADAAHEVRYAGNDMAHGDFATAEITDEDADELLGLMEDFLREMYEIPTRVQRRKDRRTNAS